MTNEEEKPEKTEEAPKPALMPPRMFGLDEISAEMGRLWNTVLGAPWRAIRTSSRQLVPAVDIYEKDGLVHVKAELPGLTDKDVEIRVDNNVLTIKGEKKEEHETKEENYYRSERSYGKFTRVVTLPDGADTDKSAARLNNGALEIDIPVKAVEAPETAKRIPIQPA